MKRTKRKIKLLAIWGFFSILTLTSLAQNTPALWRHSCNCGATDLIVQDRWLNTYVITDASLDTPRVIKLKPNGQEAFKKTIFPTGYIGMRFTNSFAKDTVVYLAGNVTDSLFHNHLFLQKIDTAGNLLQQIVIDSLEASTISGIKSAPYYNYGLYHNQQYVYIGFVTPVTGAAPDYVIQKYDYSLNLVSQFRTPLGFSAPYGPFFVTPNGTVYFPTDGYFNKLKSDFSGIEWSYPLLNYSTVNMIRAYDNGNIWFIHKEYIPNDVVLSLVKLTDNGPLFNFDYESLITRVNTSNTTDVNILEVDSASNAVFTAGYFFSPYGKTIHKYNAANGALLWSDSTLNDLYTDLLADSAGNVLAIGGGSNYYVWYYSSSGTLAYTITYDGIAHGNDMIRSSVIENNNKLIVSGTADENSNTINWATTLKYNIPFITTSLNDKPGKNNFVFPVPANDVLYVKNNDKILMAEAVDVTGKRISLVVNNDSSVNISSLRNGIYILHLYFNGYRVQTKIIVDK